MNEQPLQRIIDMRQSLSSLHEETGALLDKYGPDPAPGSQMQIELSSFVRPLSLKTAYSQSSILLEASADYLSAFIKTISEPVQTMAPWHCVRALLEAASLSSWINDLGIDARERVSRSMAFRYSGLSEQRRYLNSENESTAEVQERISEVECLAVEMGYSITKNKKGKHIGVCQRMPSSTELAEFVLGEGGTYRLLSAITHSQPFAIQQVSFSITAILHQDHDMIEVEKAISNESIEFLSNKAGKAFLVAIVRRFKIYGHWNSEVTQFLTKCASVLGLETNFFN